MEVSHIFLPSRLAGILILHCLPGSGDNMTIHLIQPLKVTAEKKETLPAISGKTEVTVHYYPDNFPPDQ